MLGNFGVMINLEKFPNLDYTPDLYLKAIEPEKEKHKEFAIKKAIIFPIDYSFTAAKFKISYEQYLEYIINVCDEYSNLFHAMVGPDPRHGPKALELMDYAIRDCGFKGLVLSPSTGISLSDPNVEKMIQRAGEYKIPVVIHDTGIVPRPLTLFSDVFQLEELFSKFVKQLFVLAPFSNMDTTLMRVAIRHADHIMADMTGFDSQYISRKMPEMVMTQFLGMLKETFGSDKLLFGSDWPWWEEPAPTREWVKYVYKMKVPLIVRPFGFPSLEDEDKELILMRNAQRILQIT
jgi:predicted TIM-barrel fold metal-dependent hydrolase